MKCRSLRSSRAAGRPRYHRQRGVALVIAMLVFSLAATFIVAMSSEFMLFMKRSSNTFVANESYAYLRGGEDLAKMALIQDEEADTAANRQRDDLTELWAQPVIPYALDNGGFLTGSIQDLSGRLYINNLNAGRSSADDDEDGQGQRRGLAVNPNGVEAFTTSQRRFLRLLQSFEEPQVSEQDARLILEAIQDWMDKDSNPSDFGAEDGYYIDAEPSYRTGNRQFSSVSELRMVAYMTPELYLAIEPYVTVWGNGSLNIQTAPAQVLRTINARDRLEPLSESEGEALVALRGEEGFESIEAMLASPVLANLDVDRNLLSETTDYFLFTGQVEVADRQATLYSVLRRQGGQVKTLLRSSGAF
ncbi:MAG: type II secretion system minor pseudopilin GspK [Halieaceae bacterium]|nr:type II secretion system minor pseudopilin GspK [Halieaceae bacterium]